MSTAVIKTPVMELVNLCKVGRSAYLEAIQRRDEMEAAMVRAEALTMPDYFIDYAADMAVANKLAGTCPELVFDPMGLSRVNVAVEAKLHEDGLFRPKDEAFAQAVRDSLESDERMARRIGEIYQRVGIDPDNVQAASIEGVERYCAAGRAEIAAATAVGQLLSDLK